MTRPGTATVFDLDDTLIDTAVHWPRVCASFTARHGHQWQYEDTAALHGNGHWAGYVAGLCGGAVTAADVVDACTTAMLKECAAGRIRAMPGAVELVHEAERHGPVAVATASPRRFVTAALDHLGLLHHLDAVVCGEDAERPKPAPDAYLHAAADLGLAPSACVAVEDSPNGIRAAAAAGMRVLAIPRNDMRLPDDIVSLLTANASAATDALPLLNRLLTEHPVPAGNRAHLW
ncbi:HAD family hydrolase [Streptomyces sp. NPDC003832]